MKQIFLIGILVFTAGCDEHVTNSTAGSPAALNPRSADLKDSQESIAESSSEIKMMETVGTDYQQKALPVAIKKLEEMNVPHRERTPTFGTVTIDGKQLLEIKYSHPNRFARAGAWLLYFDPQKPMSENPVKVNVHR